VSLSLTLKQALRGGGYTLFWRHASAAVCSDRLDLCPQTIPSGQTCASMLASTTAANWWKTCVSDAPACMTTARQLSVVPASAETTAVRTWFQSNGVTVGRVLTSEYCRCFTTAQDFQFGPALEFSADLTYWVYEEGLRCAKNVALLHETPAAGTNTAMVGHAGFTCPTLDSLAWGEAAIFKPQAPTGRTCTTVGSCAADEACVSGQCVKPLLIARVPALGTGAWSTLP
jgi:phosphohistidine phosphatase SixA